MEHIKDNDFYINMDIPDDAIFIYQGNKIFTKSELLEQLNIYSIAHGIVDGLDGLQECPTSKFNNILKDVGKYYIDKLNMLKKPNEKLNNNLLIYDKDKLEIIADTYIDLCLEYDKGISITGLMSLINGNRNLNYFTVKSLVYKDGNNKNNKPNNKEIINNNIYINNNDPNDRTLNDFQARVLKKLLDADAQLQEDKARDSKQAVLNIAYNNYKHSWNGVIKSNEIKTTIKSLDEIKQQRLNLNENNVKSAKLTYSQNDENV